MSEDPRCCGTGTCIINADGMCWCGQRWDGVEQREHIAAQALERVTDGFPDDTLAPTAASSVVLTPVGGTVVANLLNTTNTNLTANSVIIFGLKTKGGTPAQPIMTTVTPGTSFVITCGGSDTSVYNYWIMG